MSFLFLHALKRFHPLLNRPTVLHDIKGEKLSRMQLGDLGERIAALQLQVEGRKILYRNYRGPKGGEVDIVARDGDVLSFVEVKTRRSGGRGRPLDAVDLEKQALITRGANAWLDLLGTRQLPWRFDVVEVILTEGENPSLNIINNVF